MTYNLHDGEENNALIVERIRKSSRLCGRFILKECESYKLSVSNHADKSALLE